MSTNSNAVDLACIRFQIATKKAVLANLEKQINSFELDPDDYTNRYDDMLKDTYGDTVEIAGYEYSTPYALKELDPTAYRCGLVDYVNDLDLTESSAYNDLVSERDDLEDEIDDLEGEEISLTDSENSED